METEYFSAFLDLGKCSRELDVMKTFPSPKNLELGRSEVDVDPTKNHFQNHVQIAK